MNRIDQKISEKLKDFEVKPSARANQLFESKLASRTKKVFPWKYFAAAACLIILAGVAFITDFGSQKQEVALKNTEELTKPIAGVIKGDESVAPTDKKAIENSSGDSHERVMVDRQNTRVTNSQAISPKDVEQKQMFEKEDLPRGERLATITPKRQLLESETNLRDFNIVESQADLYLVGKTDIHVEQQESRSLVREKEEELKLQWAEFARNESGFLKNEGRQLKEGLNRFKEYFTK